MRWSLAQRITFRFLFSYFALFFLSDLGHGFLPVGERAVRAYHELWLPAVLWADEHVLRLGYEITLEAPGVNNTAYGWILCLCYLAVAAVVAAVWSLLDRKRAHYERLHAWFRLELRFLLALPMISYGMIKLIPSQMVAPPPPGVLLMRVGDLHPYHLLWWFVGTSPAYESFTGFAELLGGLLLLFPPAVLLGALVSAGDMLTVFVLNLCYDVSVKLLSFHLLVMSLILIAPHLRRLAGVLIFNRRVEPAMSAHVPLLSGRTWLRQAPHVLLALFGLLMLVRSYGTARERYAARHPPEPPLYGVWSVEEVVSDGKVMPLFTDPDRWRWVLVQRPGSMRVETMTGRNLGYKVDIDPEARTVKLSEPKGSRAELTYSLPDPDLLLLDGRIDGRRTQARLRKAALLRGPGG